jgi:hypothetical protein
MKSGFMSVEFVLQGQKKRGNKDGAQAAFPTAPLYHYATLLTFAHLNRCAAAILLRPAAEIVRFGFAHRAFCARLIFLRPAADMVRDAPLELKLPSAESAASIRSLGSE